MENVNWYEITENDARMDRYHIIFEGHPPDSLACDTALRLLPDESWLMVMLGGGETEPLPANRVFLSRSKDNGATWTSMQPVDLGIKTNDPHSAIIPSELMVFNERCTLFIAVHNGKFGNWRTYMVHSYDGCVTWSSLIPAPGHTAYRSFVRNHIVTSDGRILLPYQHYLDIDPKTIRLPDGRLLNTPLKPRNGVIISEDAGKSWNNYGNIRLTNDDQYTGWTENNIVALTNGTIKMIIRGDHLEGVLYIAESRDGGYTWPEVACKTTIPNPGSKATLYSLGNDAVALLHNPNPYHRSPLSLWISFDGLVTWPYQRILVKNSMDEGGQLNYPDGFVSRDRKFLHFAFDDNRHRAVYYGARLPDINKLIKEKLS